MQAIRAFSNIRVPEPFGAPDRVEVKYAVTLILRVHLFLINLSI